MASSGDVPGHGFGQSLHRLATAEVSEAANLGREVEKAPLSDADAGGRTGGITRDRAIRRTDTSEVLGVAGANHCPYQTAEAFRMHDTVTQDPNGPKEDRAGSLQGGRRVWASARTPEWREIVRGDALGDDPLLS